MRFFTRRQTGALCLIAALMFAAAWLGVGRALGAHPWWAVRVFYVGVPLGAVLSLVMHQWRGGHRAKIVVLAAALILAAGVSAVARAKFIGAEQFDAVLGRWWYFGWIAILTFLFGLVAEIVGGRK